MYLNFFLQKYAYYDQKTMTIFDSFVGKSDNQAIIFIYWRS